MQNNDQNVKTEDKDLTATKRHRKANKFYKKAEYLNQKKDSPSRSRSAQHKARKKSRKIQEDQVKYQQEVKKQQKTKKKRTRKAKLSKDDSSRKNYKEKLENNVKTYKNSRTKQHQLYQSSDQSTAPKKQHKYFEQLLQESALNKEKTVTKQSDKQLRQKAQALLKLQKQMLIRFGNKMLIEMDPNCKYFQQFRIRNNDIQKVGKLSCQIYSKISVPVKGKHYFCFKIIRMVFRSVTCGLITSKNFDNKFSRQSLNCICFDGYSHSVYTQQHKQELEVEVQLWDVLKVAVDIDQRIVQWYINNQLICNSSIPEQMAGQDLFPYLEMWNKGVRLRINEIQE